ncbi:hypothetical protein J2W23_005711 [Variovorax boronicumulans]|uniref:hypothetical protein n=1 Tax=Variovorax boronicumulans TaxID=436515 RepID=UPI00277DA0F6|nr:hypothetical protein [Variovorax boronicumulans]MDQ0017298.1 hypothetical protein [Variovorax boronicumulans]
MTVNPSDERALRLPRDFALIAVGLDVAMFVISTVVLLTRFTPDVEQIRSAYAQPEVWITMLAGLAVPWTLSAVLAWSHARNALERLGAANVALAHDARLRFGTVWALVVAFSYYGLTPLFFKIRTLFMLGGRFEEFSGYSPYLGMGAAMLVQSVVQLAVLVLGIWLAARLALSRSRGQDVAVRAPEDAAFEVSGAPPRRAVVWLIAALFASMQLWSSLAVSNWLFRSDDNTLRLLLTLLLPWLAAFALAFWGAWLGTRAGISPARPFRAVAVSVSAFVLVQVTSLVIAIAWFFLAYTSSMRMSNALGAIGATVALALVYAALVVVITRAVTRRFYRRYL